MGRIESIQIGKMVKPLLAKSLFEPTKPQFEPKYTLLISPLKTLIERTNIAEFLSLMTDEDEPVFRTLTTDYKGQDQIKCPESNKNDVRIAEFSITRRRSLIHFGLFTIAINKLVIPPPITYNQAPVK